MKSPLQNPLLFYHSRGQPASHRSPNFRSCYAVVERFVRSSRRVWTDGLSQSLDYNISPSLATPCPSVYFDFLPRASTEIFVLADRRKISS